MLADVWTLDTTYSFQLAHTDGTWHWYSQGEYTTQEAVRDFADRVYGGGVPYRIIRIECHIIDAKSAAC